MRKFSKHSKRANGKAIMTNSTNKIRDVFSRHKSKPSPIFSHKKSRVFAYNELIPGDHLSFESAESKFLECIHAIFTNFVNIDDKCLIGLSLCVDYDEHLKSMFNFEGPVQKGTVLRIHLDVNFVQIKVYKYLHQHINRADVVERSLQTNVQSTDILPFTNKTFVSYCLSGQRGIIVFIDPKKLSLKQLAEIGGTQVIGQAVETGAKVGIVVAAGTFGKLTNNTVLQSVAKGTGKLAGPVLGTAVEATNTGLKIASKKKQLNRGELTDIAFNSCIAKEATKGSAAVIGGIGGSIIGEILLPIPILGGIAGGIVGGTLGALIGTGGGKLIGNAVEQVLTNMKIKKIVKSKFYTNDEYKNTVFLICDDKPVRQVDSMSGLQSINDMIKNKELQLYEQDDQSNISDLD
ncbi:hypothetical protein GJ496_006935 [Pomphorhynchus laevis]|nr:hypothetical protein GJ496_006935 [Pomphorhynchus laevis]